MKKSFTSSGKSCIVTFDLPRAAVHDAHDVRVLGEFNRWSWEDGIRLSPYEHGFRGDLELPVGHDYQFRFLVDNRRWENQWDADAYVPTPFGVDNSVVSLRQVTHTDIVVNAASSDRGDSATPIDSRDDLTDIEGIGPAIARLLNDAGLTTFAQLAKADLPTLRAILDAGGKAFAMHEPATWPEQAFLAARGDSRALAALQARLIAGRRPEDVAS